MFADSYMPLVFYLCWTAALFAVLLLAAVDVIYTHRDETDRTTLWLILLATLPVAGVLLYILFGRSRRDTVGRRIAISAVNFRRTLRSRVRGHDYFDRLHAFLPEPSEAVSEVSRMLDRLMPETFPLKNCRVKLLHDGTAAYPAMLEAIGRAKTSVCIQSFIIADDHAGRTLMEALRKKALEGVEVRVLYDGFGSFFSAFSRFFRRFNRGLKNFQIRPFSFSNSMIQWNFQLRNHRKLLVVDSSVAFLGGINISEDNLKHKSDRFIHDLHCRVEGPAVGELLYIFLRDWFYVTKGADPGLSALTGHIVPHPCGSDQIRVIASGFGQMYEGSSNVFYTAAATARSSLWIISPYFVPDSPFVKALCMAAARGVDVRVIVPRLNNHFYVKMASRSLYGTLLDAGVRIFEREKVFVHTKAMLVDREWGMLGSSNCDVRSFRLNFELDIVLRGEDVLRDLSFEFGNELENSREVFSGDPAEKNAYSRVVENFCALFRPML